MDIGLIPLPNNEWKKGKCSFYMACCIPVIVSPLGMNSAVLVLGEVRLGANSTADWYEALVFFYKNRSLGHNFGENGRQIVEDNFNQKAICQKLVKVFQYLI
ncbi:glycosyltransferase [Trichormus azollae]|jgi:glycosyltransferase involved in cell wall biosynthesis|uniref:glycosyltransferase n=1 Tax=Trichormus azollae TaxID=1164 RepID=UPI0001957422|nr:hypothetical protein [Trichormus azollae]